MDEKDCVLVMCGRILLSDFKGFEILFFSLLYKVFFIQKLGKYQQHLHLVIILSFIAIFEVILEIRACGFMIIIMMD